MRYMTWEGRGWGEVHEVGGEGVGIIWYIFRL